MGQKNALNGSEKGPARANLGSKIPFFLHIWLFLDILAVSIFGTSFDPSGRASLQLNLRYPQRPACLSHDPHVSRCPSAVRQNGGVVGIARLPLLQVEVVAALLQDPRLSVNHRDNFGASPVLSSPPLSPICCAPQQQVSHDRRPMFHFSDCGQKMFVQAGVAQWGFFLGWT